MKAEDAARVAATIPHGRPAIWITNQNHADYDKLAYLVQANWAEGSKRPANYDIEIPREVFSFPDYKRATFTLLRTEFVFAHKKAACDLVAGPGPLALLNLAALFGDQELE